MPSVFLCALTVYMYPHADVMTGKSDYLFRAMYLVYDEINYSVF